MCAWNQAVKRFADLDVVLVRVNGEAGVSESLNLLDYVCDNARCAVTNVGYTDTGAQVDNLIAIDIEKNCVTCAFNCNREGKT